MTKRLGFLLLAIALGVAGMVAMGVHPQAEEVEENEPPAVSESDIELYINVYTAMQNDHDLTIDSAIKPYHLSLEDFRKIELRIQNQPRLVERVRQALLENAKEHSVFAQSISPPMATATPDRHRSQRLKKK